MDDVRTGGRATLTVEEAAQLLRIGRGSGYEAAREVTFPRYESDDVSSPRSAPYSACSTTLNSPTRRERSHEQRGVQAVRTTRLRSNPQSRCSKVPEVRGRRLHLGV